MNPGLLPNSYRYHDKNNNSLNNNDIIKRCFNKPALIAQVWLANFD
jgi:hypothetical protein